MGHGTVTGPQSVRTLTRAKHVRRAYLLSLGILVPADVLLGAGPAGNASLGLLTALMAIAVVSYSAAAVLGERLGAALDAGIALAALGLLTAGPLFALLLMLFPDAIHIARRRRQGNFGLLANVVSYAAAALAGAGALALLPGHGGLLRAVWVLLAGTAMAVANYVFARLLYATLHDGEGPLDLLRREFLAFLPAELAMLAMAATVAALTASLGPLALALFAAIVCIPQWAVAWLLRAPSVARLSVDDAAARYLDALSDELRLSRRTRQAIHAADAIASRQTPPYIPGQGMGAATFYALEAELARCSPASRPQYRPPLGAQVLLAARAWAELTARNTRALTHAEAMAELWRGNLATDAREALAAALAIVTREHTLTRQTYGVPRLHLLPLPRSLRAEVLPEVVGRYGR